MGTFVEELSNCCDYFLRLSGFPNLSGKVCLITFKFSYLNFQQYFAEPMLIKQFDIFSFVKVWRDYNG